MQLLCGGGRDCESADLRVPRRRLSVHGPHRSSSPKILAAVLVPALQPAFCVVMVSCLWSHTEVIALTAQVAPGITGRTKPTKVKKQAGAQKRKRDHVDVEQLDEAVAELVQCSDCGCRMLFPLTDLSRISKMALTKTFPTCRSQVQPRPVSNQRTSP